MQVELLELLRCPKSGEPLELQSAEYEEGRVREGWLISKNSGYRYPIHKFILRFVPESNYADNFGLQWNLFRQTQLDSYSGQPISADRFWKATGWSPDDLAGQWVLDCGCGAGRFAEVALNAGARVVALDYSSAVDACYANLKHHPSLNVVQGDIYLLPFVRGFFPFVYSLGVLQHTPDVDRAFSALPAMVAGGGQLCVDFYWKRLRTMLHLKDVLRPFTKRINKARLFKVLQRLVPFLLPVSQAFGRVPFFGRFLKRLVPVADYTGIYPLTSQQLEEWALLDTFDMLAPVYDNPQTPSVIKSWFVSYGMADIQAFHSGHLVARGRKER